MHPGWMWEGGYPLLYRDIDDALCTDVTRQEQFSLHLKMAGENYPRRAYCKLPCPLELSPQFPVPTGGVGTWTFSIWAKAEALDWAEKVGAGVSFRIWNRKEGLMPHDINRPPEETRTITFDRGSYDWKEYRYSLEVTEETAVILITVFGEHGQGDLWLEGPSFSNSAGWQILPQFTLSNQYHPYMNWLGENLSHKEWTSLEVTVNGKTLPCWELFQRCHNGSENELPLPDGCLISGENQIVSKNVNDYFAPHPYRLMRAELLWEEIRPLRVLAAPFAAHAGKILPILVETADPSAEIQVSVSSGAEFSEIRSQGLWEGMQVVRLKAGEAGPGFSVTLSSGGCRETVEISRVISRGDDNVLTGTSDTVYISQEDLPLMRDFMVWYLHHRLGNFITFRPVYRWTGGRELNPECWEKLRALCEAMELPYCHIIDGRELPGNNANPPLALLEGEKFVGCQGHERDGALNYWAQRSTAEPYLTFHELCLQEFSHPDYRYSCPVVYTDHGTFLYFDPIAPKNMKECAEQFVQKSAISLAGIKRHTGPSVLFRYFFQGGLEVGGAELMYGPQEIIIAAMRGASRAYGRKETVGHLAVQWSSTPHDTPERYRRYQLALFVSWLQGVNHINTEEGLYRMEEEFSVFDRFDDACIAHREMQEDFAQFVNTHTRRGKLVIPYAMIHGRYDGWSCFGRRRVWGHLGEEWAFGLPEESWDLLKVFYPDSVLNALYEHPCPNRPVGFYSRTPYSAADILPIETDGALLAEYPFLAFLGYNGAEPGDVEKLAEYVQNGGALLLTWAHLNQALDRKGLLYGDPDLPDTQKLVGFNPRGFSKEGGVRLGLLPDGFVGEVLEKAESGQPLVICRKLGNGRVFLVNAAEYPAHPKIRPVYEQLLARLAAETSAKEYAKGWVTGNDTVQTTVYDQENGLRTIYAIHTGWWLPEDTPAKAVLRLAGREALIAVPRGVISSITLAGEAGVMVSDNEAEVLSLALQGEGLSLEIQGKGKAELRLFLPAGLRPENGEMEGKGVWRLPLQLDGLTKYVISCHAEQ